MNRIRLAPLALVMAWSSAAMGQNLLANPGFEESTPGNYWQMWKSPDAVEGEAAISYPDTGAHEGAKYARVEVTTPSAENWHIQLQIPPDWMADSGVGYELKFWARSDSSSSIHLGIQDGPANNYTYRSGMDFALTPEWMEQSLTYESDRTGNGELRFNLYLGRSKDVYGFDGFSLTKLVVGVRGASRADSRALQVRQGNGRLVVSLDGGSAGVWKAGLYDLRGVAIASAAGKAGSPLSFARPREKGIYLIKAADSRRSWVRKVSFR